MPFIRPVLPSFDPVEWKQLPFPERARAVCLSWAEDGYGTPVAIFLLYVLKIVAFVGIWAWACSATPGLGPLTELGSWFAEPLALYKLVVWSMLFEVMGFGCGSGPLTARYMPPIGGFLYFLRPGTTRLPPAPGLPGCSGHVRSVLDVALYAGLLLALAGELLGTRIGGLGGIVAVVLLPLAGLRDRTLFLAARGEHYWVALAVALLSSSSGESAVMAGWMGLWGALWFFAGVSKLNRHFETVVCVMMSNSPVMRSVSMRRAMYRDFPRDLRPSTLARLLGHFGTLLELAVPLILLTAGGSHPQLLVGLGLMWMLHTYITVNVPMGVPLEWNVVMVYGGMALFWGNPELGLLDATPSALGLLLVSSVAVPVLGNVFPERVSFLPSMRYYAGNWAMSVWLFKDGTHRKLEALPRSAPWVEDQLGSLYDARTIAGLLSKVMAFRLMHLHGRVLGAVLPQAIEEDLAQRSWIDGEVVAGLVLGWNFGDGHLHGEALLQVVRERCGFEAGELRVITVESQPIHRAELSWSIHDAAEGVLERGVMGVAELRERQPWDLGRA